MPHGGRRLRGSAMETMGSTHMLGWLPPTALRW